MVVPLDPIRAIKCNIEGCFQSFGTLQEMKRHKLDDPTHFYCKKCNVDCDSWADLIEHKVDGMAPWLECKPEDRPKGNPPHICCEFCGEDFRSLGGRMLHRERYHQAAQSITCPGCTEIFGSAGDMIMHLERDECDGIPAIEFYAQLQHKYIKKEIMKDIDGFTQRLSQNAALTFPTHPDQVDTDLTTVPIGTKTDGVVILDGDDEEQNGGTAPLEAKIAVVNLNGNKVQLTRSNLENWPRLPSGYPSVATNHVLNQSIGSLPPSVISMDMSASEFASRITGHDGGANIHTESHPSLFGRSNVSKSNHSPKDSTNDNNDGDTASVSTTKPEGVLHLPAAWATTDTSRTLFGNIPKAPQPIEEENEPKAPNLLLNARWWDPYSKDYTSDIFIDSATSNYMCPFPSCELSQGFLHPHDIEGHLLEFHSKTKFVCPTCYKHFKRAAGMVSHIESTMKCEIRNSSKFQQVLDDVTGGFIRAKKMPKRELYRSTTDVVKSGQVVDGVMGTMYKADWPSRK